MDIKYTWGPGSSTFWSDVAEDDNSYYCKHEWVNVSLLHIKEVCKKCDKEKETKE